MNTILDSERIDLFIQALMKVARGDYSVQLALSEENNDLDALAMGINMMVDNLKISHDIEQENEEIKLLNLQLLEAKGKAEESDHLKSAFLANMSHEIRTPMNGIMGFADLLKSPNLTGEEQQEYISIIEQSGDRMLNIINDIIDISKIESGLMKVELVDSNINEQIEYIHTFFKPEVIKKGMKLLYKNSLTAKDAIIKTDREKLFAILTNLVKNAIKYSNKGSIELGYEKKDNYLEFFIKDTGIGIPKNRQKAIFERFIQADISGKMAIQGAGLGLSISKAYVEMLGGKIRVKSDENIGSTFYFTLPYNSKPEPVKFIITDQGTKNQFNMEGLKLNILIVEDDDTSKMLISQMVKNYSKKIINTSNGLDAIKACHDNLDIDLILMDIQLPLIGGYEVTRQIRQFNKDVIIIAQTAYALNGDREKAIEAGCNDYISKPIYKGELLALVNKYFKI